VDQYWVAWLTAILFAVLLVAEVLFFPETLYPRNLMLSRLPTSSGPNADSEKAAAVSASNDIARTRQLPFLNIWMVPGIEHPKPWDTLIRFIQMWTFPNVVFAVVVYSFAWSVSSLNN